MNGAMRNAVAASFGAAADGYEALAKIQRECAADLLSLFHKVMPELPDGPVLEIGCGTGFVTRGLVRKVRHRALCVTDLSPQMVAYCRESLGPDIVQTAKVAFKVLDAHEMEETEERYALIIGGFVLQWLHDPLRVIDMLCNALLPGGYLLLSFPTSRSFPEWRHFCERLDVPFAANPLPDPDIIQRACSADGRRCFSTERVLTETFPSPSDFLRSLKAIGASTKLTGNRLTVSQMRRLLRAWEQQSTGGITGSYHVVFGILRRC